MKAENKVILHACDHYDETRLSEIFRKQMDLLGLDRTFFAGKKTVIKERKFPK